MLSLEELSASTGIYYSGATYSMESSYSAPIESGMVTVTAQVEATVARQLAFLIFRPLPVLQ